MNRYVREANRLDPRPDSGKGPLSQAPTSKTQSRDQADLIEFRTETSMYPTPTGGILLPEPPSATRRIKMGANGHFTGTLVYVEDQGLVDRRLSAGKEREQLRPKSQ